MELPEFIHNLANEQYIVIEGTLGNGYAFTGPFDDNDSAVAYAERYCNDNYDIVGMFPPVKDDD